MASLFQGHQWSGLCTGESTCTRVCVCTCALSASRPAMAGKQTPPPPVPGLPGPRLRTHGSVGQSHGGSSLCPSGGCRGWARAGGFSSREPPGTSPCAHRSSTHGWHVRPEPRAHAQTWPTRSQAHATPGIRGRAWPAASAESAQAVWRRVLTSPRPGGWMSETRVSSFCVGLCPDFLLLDGHQSHWIRSPYDLIRP